MVVERLRHSPPLPPVSSTPVGAARSRPGRQVGDPYQAQKLLACQPTGYHLFTIHSYLLPSPTQVGDAGRVRELTYSYKLRSGIKKSLADWRDFSVYVGITYLPGKSPCKYCRRR